MDALTTLIATFPASADPLRSALADHVAHPTRESWRLVVVLADTLGRLDGTQSAPEGTCNGFALSDEQMMALFNEVHNQCDAQGWPELADLLGPGDAEIAEELGELIADVKRLVG